MHTILALCTGNATRSILAEAIFNRDGTGRVLAYSAGVNPNGTVHPATMRLLERRGLRCSGYRSKSWAEFTADGAPPMDLIVTLCGAAAAEIPPAWPGNPLIVHWGVEDPATAPADQIDLAFQIAYHRLSARINAFLALPFESMDKNMLRCATRNIGAL